MAFWIVGTRCPLSARYDRRTCTHALGSWVYIPPKVWAIQYRYSPDALLLVLASDKYDPADYIRDYDEFVRLVAGK